MSIKKIDLSTRIFVKKKTDLEVQMHFLSGIRKILLKVHIHQSWWNQIVSVSEALTRTDFDWRQCGLQLRLSKCQSATTFLLSTSHTLTKTFHFSQLFGLILASTEISDYEIMTTVTYSCFLIVYSCFKGHNNFIFLKTHFFQVTDSLNRNNKKTKINNHL